MSDGPQPREAQPEASARPLTTPRPLLSRPPSIRSWACWRPRPGTWGPGSSTCRHRGLEGTGWARDGCPRHARTWHSPTEPSIISPFSRRGASRRPSCTPPVWTWPASTPELSSRRDKQEALVVGQAWHGRGGGERAARRATRAAARPVNLSHTLSSGPGHAGRRGGGGAAQGRGRGRHADRALRRAPSPGRRRGGRRLRRPLPGAHWRGGAGWPAGGGGHAGGKEGGKGQWGWERCGRGWRGQERCCGPAPRPPRALTPPP